MEPTTPATSASTTPTPSAAQTEALAGALKHDVQHGLITQAEYDSKIAGLGKGSAPNTVPNTAQSPAPVSDQAATVPVNQWGSREKELIRQDLDKALALNVITKEQYLDDMQRCGIQALPADNRTEDAKVLDKLHPPARPEEFLFPRYDGDGTTLSKEQRAFDKTARGWLSSARFDKQRGSSLAKEVNRVAEHTAKMSEGELELYGRKEWMKLERIYGKELVSKLQMTAGLISELEAMQPGLKALLKQRGIGDSALVVSMLIGQAEILAKRKGY